MPSCLKTNSSSRFFPWAYFVSAICSNITPFLANQGVCFTVSFCFVFCFLGWNSSHVGSVGRHAIRFCALSRYSALGQSPRFRRKRQSPHCFVSAMRVFTS
jgi:uncharacterized membrane protein YccC